MRVPTETIKHSRTQIERGFLVFAALFAFGTT